jgi:hypothetical protein
LWLRRKLSQRLRAGNSETPSILWEMGSVRLVHNMPFAILYCAAAGKLVTDLPHLSAVLQELVLE